MKIAIFIGLLLSVILISGCVQQETTTTTSTTTEPVMTTEELENQATDLIEQEMEEAIEGIDTSDIEDLIPE